MRTGIFGGTFNPPHIGHLIVAETLREQFGLKQVLWIPSRLPPHRMDEAMPSAEDRLEMTRRAVEQNPFFEVSDMELRREGPSYTIDTVRLLKQAEPEKDFVLLMGGDSYRALSTWREADKLAEMVPLIVYDRRISGPEPMPLPFEARVEFAEAPLIDVSATFLRGRIADGRSVRYYVPHVVMEYIHEHHLYRTPL
jgi:nicotinate-nucleotide adenylyltransferase